MSSTCGNSYTSIVMITHRAMKLESVQTVRISPSSLPLSPTSVKLEPSTTWYLSFNAASRQLCRSSRYSNNQQLTFELKNKLIYRHRSAWSVCNGCMEHLSRSSIVKVSIAHHHHYQHRSNQLSFDAECAERDFSFLTRMNFRELYSIVCALTSHVEQQFQKFETFPPALNFILLSLVGKKLQNSAELHSSPTVHPTYLLCTQNLSSRKLSTHCEHNIMKMHRAGNLAWKQELNEHWNFSRTVCLMASLHVHIPKLVHDITTKTPKNREWTEVDWIRCYDVSSAEAWQAHKVGKFNYFFALPLSLFAASSSNTPRFHSFQPQKSDFVTTCSSVVILFGFLCKDKREKCK